MRSGSLQPQSNHISITCLPRLQPNNSRVVLSSTTRDSNRPAAQAPSTKIPPPHLPPHSVDSLSHARDNLPAIEVSSVVRCAATGGDVDRRRRTAAVGLRVAHDHSRVRAGGREGDRTDGLGDVLEVAELVQELAARPAIGKVGIDLPGDPAVGAAVGGEDGLAQWW